MMTPGEENLSRSHVSRRASRNNLGATFDGERVGSRSALGWARPARNSTCNLVQNLDGIDRDRRGHGRPTHYRSLPRPEWTGSQDWLDRLPGWHRSNRSDLSRRSGTRPQYLSNQVERSDGCRAGRIFRTVHRLYVDRVLRFALELA